jgi:hypothetical protein
MLNDWWIGGIVIGFLVVAGLLFLFWYTGFTMIREYFRTHRQARRDERREDRRDR